MRPAVRAGHVVLVAGAGGFIGGWMTRRLRERGISIRAVDVKALPQWRQRFDDVENLSLDLRRFDHCERAVAGIDWIYNFACDMGGLGFISTHRADCMVSVLINTNLLRSAVAARARRYFFASSACVYSTLRQQRSDASELRESDAYPAMPEDGYGWEKLFSERLCLHMMQDYGLQTRVARLHNVYGPHGDWRGGREKAPAALCRKIAIAARDGGGEIEIWGEGTQTRSFMAIEDCLVGIEKIMNSDIGEPINLGSDQRVTINQLSSLIAAIADVPISHRYRLDGPVGVCGRASDNTLIRNLLGWAPSISLRDGLPETYRWIEGQLDAEARSRSGATERR